MVWLGWYCLFNKTLCQYLLRFIIIINKYFGTGVLVSMTACDIAPLVRVVFEVLYFKRRGRGADKQAVLLPSVQPDLPLLILHGRMCGCSAAVVRGGTTEILLL